jgi:hypothetical protein
MHHWATATLRNMLSKRKKKPHVCVWVLAVSNINLWKAAHEKKRYTYTYCVWEKVEEEKLRARMLVLFLCAWNPLYFTNFSSLSCGMIHKTQKHRFTFQTASPSESGTHMTDTTTVRTVCLGAYISCVSRHQTQPSYYMFFLVVVVVFTVDFCWLHLNRVYVCVCVCAFLP